MILTGEACDPFEGEVRDKIAKRLSPAQRSALIRISQHGMTPEGCHLDSLHRLSMFGLITRIEFSFREFATTRRGYAVVRRLLQPEEGKHHV